VDAPRKIMLMSNSILCALILAYATTPWHRAADGLVTFVGSVLVVSGLSLWLALRRHRLDKMASTGQRR
jgi:hypothetical protein